MKISIHLDSETQSIAAITDPAVRDLYAQVLTVCRERLPRTPDLHSRKQVAAGADVLDRLAEQECVWLTSGDGALMLTCLGLTSITPNLPEDQARLLLWALDLAGNLCLWPFNVDPVELPPAEAIFNEDTTLEAYTYRMFRNLARAELPLHFPVAHAAMIEKAVGGQLSDDVRTQLRHGSVLWLHLVGLLRARTSQPNPKSAS